MCDQDEAFEATQFFSNMPVHVSDHLRQLQVDQNNVTDSSIADPDDGDANSSPAIHWILWGCVGLLVAYILYRVYRLLLRRARILRSEHAMDHLGDLQMLPSEDFSDQGLEDEEKDNELL